LSLPSSQQRFLDDFLGKAAGCSPAEYQARFETMTHLRRLTTLAELGDTAAFVASDRASAMTGTVVNLSGGGAPG